jgi:tetratricopeptide (TPR) repeat protein
MGQLEPSVTAHDAALAAKHVASGEAALYEGDLVASINHLRQALRLVPGDVAIMRQLGEALAANADTVGAEAILAEAARIAPGDAAVLVDLAHVRQLLGDRTGARLAIEQAAVQSDAAAIRVDQVRLYESLGETHLAVATLAEVVRATPTPALLVDLARLYLELEQYADADEAFRRLGALGPEQELLALHGRIWSQIKRRDWRSALGLALHAARLDRFNLTTALLSYAGDRLFTRLPSDEIAARESQLEARFTAELHEHAENSGTEDAIMPAGTGED